MNRNEYVCNQMYKQHALLRRDSWTDADKLEYMELNIAPYSRYWRMGMKKALKHAIKLLREEEAEADRKTEPTISKMEQVDKDINVRSKDEPQRNMAEDIVESFGFKAESYRQAKAKTEPQTERRE